MAGEPLVLTRPSQLNAARLGRRRFGAGTTRRESRRLPSRVPGEPETRGALDLDGQGPGTTVDGCVERLRTARHSRALVEQLLGTLRLNHPRTSVNGRRILTPCRHRRSVLRRWLESAPAATGSVFTCRRHSCPWTDPGKSTSREGQAVHESHGHEADDIHPARPAPDRPPPTLAGGSVRIGVVPGKLVPSASCLMRDFSQWKG